MRIGSLFLLAILPLIMSEPTIEGAATAGVASAQSNPAQQGAPIIRKVDVGVDERHLLIFGRFFCPAPIVKLSTTRLEIVDVSLSADPHRIAAKIPDALAAVADVVAELSS